MNEQQVVGSSKTSDTFADYYGGALDTSEKYSPRILLCVLQDLLFWTETAAQYQRLTDAEVAHVRLYASRLRSAYGEARVVPTDETLASPDAVRLPNTLCPRCHQFHFEVEDTEAGCIQLLLGLVRKFRLAQPSEADRLVKALGMLYDKWEEGTSCYEDPEDCAGYLGNAFKLTQEEEAQILALLPPGPALKAFVQLCAPHGKDWLTCPECAKAAVNGASNVAR